MLSPRRATVASLLVLLSAPALLDAAPPASTSAGTKLWNGDVKGGVVWMRIGGGEVKFFGMSRDFGKCTRPPQQQSQGFPDAGRVRDGRFSARYEDSRKVFELSGRLLGDGRARGSFRSKLKGLCDTGAMAWTARVGPAMKPGRWRGKVDGEHPISMVVADDGVHIKRLATKVPYTCPNSTSVGEVKFHGVLVHRDGSFTDEHANPRETVTGRARRRTAAGTIEGTNFFNKRCRTPRPVEWTATWRG